ncbi:erv26 super protein [Linnemannia hyalina]|uniref:Erv26 super protein n=1 Tax=Linnemannia hyalina TaxID=64524 RepID=A0A9P7Y5Q6_9FUNG|nr:erv26 super protein [Linnemannia hyalina]
MPAGVTLSLISYIGTAIAFVFATLSLACGLYYLAELVEEYTVLTKKIIKGLTLGVVGLHLMLWIVDGLPFTKILFSLACHIVYSTNLSNFPYISLVSIPFLSSVVLVLVDHFMWFQYFANKYYSFMSIASFFGICVWLVPFTYFISLSANDNALPSFDHNQQDNKQKKAGILKTLFGAILNKKDSSIPTLVETPKYTGFGSSSLGSSTHMHQNQHLAAPTPMAGAPSSRPSSPYAFNPEKNYNQPDYISRPSSSNSNHANFGTPRQQTYQGNSNTNSNNNSPMNSYTGGGGQTYASSSSVYTHSGSTVGNRF